MATVADTMSEFKHGELRSGSKHGPRVTSRRQAIAIAMSQERKAKGDPKKKRFTIADAIGSKLHRGHHAK